MAGGWKDVSVGAYHSCAIGAGESLWCWGDNSYGQLGASTPATSSTPLQLTNVGWAKLALGFLHSCALKNDKSLWCWGTDFAGQLGDGGSSNSQPIEDSGFKHHFSLIESHLQNGR
jgi:Regulator of chromosome condensation (RCC1) repeat